MNLKKNTLLSWAFTLIAVAGTAIIGCNDPQTTNRGSGSGSGSSGDSVSVGAKAAPQVSVTADVASATFKREAKAIVCTGFELQTKCLDTMKTDQFKIVAVSYDLIRGFTVIGERKINEQTGIPEEIKINSYRAETASFSRGFGLGASSPANSTLIATPGEPLSAIVQAIYAISTHNEFDLAKSEGSIDVAFAYSSDHFELAHENGLTLEDILADHAAKGELPKAIARHWYLFNGSAVEAFGIVFSGETFEEAQVAVKTVPVTTWDDRRSMLPRATAAIAGLNAQGFKVTQMLLDPASINSVRRGLRGEKNTDTIVLIGIKHKGLSGLNQNAQIRQVEYIEGKSSTEALNIELQAVASDGQHVVSHIKGGIMPEIILTEKIDSNQE